MLNDGMLGAKSAELDSLAVFLHDMIYKYGTQLSVPFDEANKKNHQSNIITH